MVLETFSITWGFAARPFLPAGQGGLILIAGGLSMTVFAMLILMARHHPIGAGTGQRARPPPTRSVSTSGSGVTTVQRSRPVAGPVFERAVAGTRQPSVGNDRLVWPDYVRRAAARAGLGSTTILAVDRTRCIIEVKKCRSCRRGRRGCEKEKRRLRHAARKLSRRARVREVSCNAEGRHICTFQIEMGAKR